ncbi:MAG: hypothetical protein WC606_05570, partial [Candidatus Absconditabacterales bacterium]
NFFLYISDLPTGQAGAHPFITQTIDHFFPFDEYSVTKNTKLYKLKKIYPLKDSTVKYKNVFFFGSALKLLGIVREEGEKLLASQFSGDSLTENIAILAKGYEHIKTATYDLSKNVGPAKQFVFGNEMVGTGAVAAGMDFYAAYPMTPASSLIDVVIENKAVTFFQGEDEIAVSIAMLGAKFAGKRAMCGTSGGGFALMTESISFSNQAELGGVYILSQRDGPSTGTPTYTGQSDLNYALNASFGDTYPIVLAPSTFEEGYTLIGKALNRSDQYQHPVIFLIDKQFSESYLSIDTKSLVVEEINRGKLRKIEEDGGKSSDDYKRYADEKDGISPVVIPGTENGEFIATSYEHDEYGATNEDPTFKKQQQDKRFRKLDTFVQQEFTEDFYGYEIINPDAKKFFVTYGVNRYVLADFIRQKNLKKSGRIGEEISDTISDLSDISSDFGLIIMKVFQPFDMKLKEFLDEKNKQIKQLIFVEMNKSGQMEERVTNKCLLHDAKWEGKINHYRKYTLYPIFLEEIEGIYNG